MDDQGAVVEALALAIAARLPVLLWGAPGTGKTTVVRAIAERAPFSFERLPRVEEILEVAGVLEPDVTARGKGRA